MSKYSKKGIMEMSDAKKIELKPCPFCGQKCILVSDHYELIHEADCWINSHSIYGKSYLYEDRRWNTRNKENTPEKKLVDLDLKTLTEAVADSYAKLEDEGNVDHCRRIITTIYNRLAIPERRVPTVEIQKLLADLKDVGHHTVDEELWRVEKFLALFAKTEDKK